MSSRNSRSTLRPNQKPCPLCGRPMHRQSPKCRECFLAGKVRPENYLTRLCQKCGESFTVHKCHVERGYGKYCSMSCARSGSPTRKRKPHVAECATCGARFDRHICEAARRKGGKNFCSSLCWYSFNQRDNHYLWAGGQHDRMNPEGVKWRKAVLKRDRYHCRICHATRRLEAHHILPFGTNPEIRWEVSNGLTLCHDCHVKFRHRELEYAEALKIIASVPVEVWRVESR
jgi:hypothetical protein